MALSIWLLFNGVVNLVLGCLFIFQFEMIVGSLGVTPQHGSAAIELVTFYGGLEAGFGILFVAALFVKRYQRFALQLLTFSYLCFTAGRVTGMLGHTVTGNMTWYLFAFEVIGLTISAHLLKKHQTAT